MFRNCTNHIVKFFIKHCFDINALIINTNFCRIVTLLPTRNCINLICCNNKRSLILLQNLNALICLWFKTFININNQNSKICKGPSTSTKGSKSMMSRSVNKQQTRERKLLVFQKISTNTIDCVNRNLSCTNVLGDSTTLTRCYCRASDKIKKGSFSMINMPQHANNGLPDIL